MDARNLNLNCVHTMKLHCGNSERSQCTVNEKREAKKVCLNYNKAGNVNMKQTLAFAE